jgi:hypothetical protein
MCGRKNCDKEEGMINILKKNVMKIFIVIKENKFKLEVAKLK